MERIADRVAFVTGGASGIGLAIAKALIAAGAKVAIADVNADALDREAAALGEDAIAIQLDVTDRDDWAAAKVAVEAQFGSVDILVNNAGIGPDLKPLADMDPASFDRLVAIKVNGTFNGIATFAAGMRERGDGHIVNTASMAGLIASARLGAYTASKFAVVGLSEVLRAEMEEFGVGVSVLCPGLVRTNLGSDIDRADNSIRGTADGIDAAIVGDLVIDGIRNNHMHILTHGEYAGVVAQRMTRIAEAFDRVPVRDPANLPGAAIAKH